MKSSENISALSGTEKLRVMSQMIFDKGRYEIVAMVVTLVPALLEWQAALGASCFQQFRPQLFFEKRITKALIDENLAE